MGTIETLAVREVRKRYPDYTGQPQQHPTYHAIWTEIQDYVDDVWNYEAWETAEGERFSDPTPLSRGARYRLSGPDQETH